jgi:hypothetical protein
MNACSVIWNQRRAISKPKCHPLDTCRSDVDGMQPLSPKRIGIHEQTVEEYINAPMHRFVLC